MDARQQEHRSEVLVSQIKLGGTMKATVASVRRDSNRT
jgi:hypothetical protein